MQIEYMKFSKVNGLTVKQLPSKQPIQVRIPVLQQESQLQNSSREYCSGLQYNIGHRIPGVHEVTEVYRDLCNLLETHGSEKVENILHDNPVSPIDGD